MSSNRDVEAAILNREPIVNSKLKMAAMEMEKSPNTRRESNERHSSRENMIDERNMHLLDQPTSPLLGKDENHRKPPLAVSEVDDLDSPGINEHSVMNNGLLKREHEDKNHGGDEVDTRTTERGAAEDSTSDGAKHEQDEEDGNLHGKDQVDYFGDINGPHYGLDARFADRPLSAMELDQRIIPDVNVYQQKKNLAQGMMDLALLSANANQLRYVIESNAHPYYWPSLVFISLSVIFQVLVGIGLIMNSAYNVKNEDDICKADKINNLTVIGIFLVTIINVFIAAFGVVQNNAGIS